MIYRELLDLYQERFVNARRERDEAVQVLRRLAEAADVYAADQTGATDDRCGVVQPVSVSEAQALLDALSAAWGFLSSPWKGR